MLRAKSHRCSRSCNRSHILSAQVRSQKRRRNHGTAAHMRFQTLIYLFIYMHAFIHSLIHIFTHAFMHSFMLSFIHSFIHSCIYSFIHSFVHPFLPSLLLSFLPSSFIHNHIDWNIAPVHVVSTNNYCGGAPVHVVSTNKLLWRCTRACCLN